MHAAKLLQTFLKKSCLNIHQKRLDCLFDVIPALILCGKLWITELGRNIRNQTTQKHNIKKVDGLVGNLKLHNERLAYYQYLTRTLIGTKTRPIIIIDWSPVSADCEHNILRASVTGVGRTQTIYEEVHELKYYGNEKVHQQFLKTIFELLPKSCKPIIVTDAGFRNTWFKQILALGWDIIGRLRHNTQVRLVGEDQWQSGTSLHNLARLKPKHLGQATVARSNPINMGIYIMLGKQKKRIKKTKLGKKCQSSTSKKYAKGAKEPWVIVTSLKHTSTTAKKVMKVYKARMQIEESFRDLKDKRHGFRLPESKTKSVARLENLLLIALLATFSIWLAGQVALNKDWHYQLQANTVRVKNVLSIAFIGIQILRNLQLYELLRDD